MTTREGWGSRVGLVLAMAGNAVGLGNFLRFPAQAAQNGGGAFLIPYLVSFALMGLPLLWVEWSIGRHGGQYGHHSAPGLMDVLGKQKWLKYVGVFGLFTNMMIAAYYTYLESWTLAYVFHSIIGTFSHVNPTEFFPNYVGTSSGSIFTVPYEALFWFLITAALNVWILSRGLVKGIEMMAKIGMPILLLFAVVLAIRGLTLGGGDVGVIQSPLAGLNFVWEPRASGLLNPTTWMAAAGQIFFTLSVGMGSIHCYASYLKAKQDVALNGASAGWMNMFVEVVLGGSVIIPIAVAYLGITAVQEATLGGSGFALGFLTLPNLFNNWGALAPVAGALWFGLLFFAGITSSMAMGQPLMAFAEDEYKFSRNGAAVLFGVAVLLLGFVCVWLYPGGAFDEFDFWTGTFALVVFALLEALIFTRIFGMEKGWAEITRGADMKVPAVFKYIIKYVTPVFIGVIFLGAMIQPDGAWSEAVSGLFQGNGWPLSPASVIGRVFHVGERYVWFENGQPTRALVQDATRTLLLVVFLGFGLLVRNAWRRKEARS